jgi:hypothetical protein
VHYPGKVPKNLQTGALLPWKQVEKTGWSSKRFDIMEAKDESQVLFGINPLFHRMGGVITEIRIAIQSKVG